MHIHSYNGCKVCLMRACCSQICDPYKRSVFKKFDLKIKVSKIALEKIEPIVCNFLEYARYYLINQKASVQEIKPGNICIVIEGSHS